MHGKTIVVTGITGFIGQHLANFLNDHYPTCQIIGLCRNKPKIAQKYVCDSIDLSNKEAVVEIISKLRPDYVIHLAGKVFSFDWNELYRANVLSTIHLLEAVKLAQCQTHTVIVGSAAEYGNVLPQDLPAKESLLTFPQSPYGMSKLWQTNLARYYANQNVSVNVARLFNVIGLGTATQLSTGDMFAQIHKIILGEQEPRIIVGNLAIKRDFIDILDACAGLIALASQGERGQIYNICSGYSVAFKDILDVCIRAVEIDIEIVVDKNKPQNAYVENMYGCNLKIKNATGWKPIITLENSIKTVFERQGIPG